MPKPLKAPTLKAPIEEHKKHADEFLAREEHKDPKKVNKPEYTGVSDEAKP